ncbi:hypothetical protein GOP47_0006524 [Adiantum capillus-veneris]|uniref:Plastid lipid-associated protein/fibrillin conserved domain-containing protein n=1 Tax=Adiantum capillus-veneris TaxID=13818 RepID=A0A9D4V389_ADICA|nr:hypothetical protein GOP47_0006524 [Adiantum capillus-veneris]
MAATYQTTALDQIAVCHRRPPSLPAFHLHHQQCLPITTNVSMDVCSLAAGRQLRRRSRGIYCVASSSSTSTSTSMYAKEMERVAAKEALLLAIQDAGGDNVLSPSTANATARIDVNERIVSLERLNPTPRPTTSPLLEGLWQFKWIGAGSPGQLAARIVLQRFPSAVVTISDLTISILDGSAKAIATVKLFNSVLSSVTLTSKLSVEGPLRLKEEYVEGLLSSPALQEGSVPVQVKDAYGQFLNAIQRLPDAIKDTLMNGVKVPLAGTFERQLLISYLDDEVLVARDGSGVPEVLVRVLGSAPADTEPVSEYVS